MRFIVTNNGFTESNKQNKEIENKLDNVLGPLHSFYHYCKHQLTSANSFVVPVIEKGISTYNCREVEG